MTTPKRGRGRPPTLASTHHSESVEVRLTPALRASLEADAAAARLTLSDLCRARLGAAGEDDGALRAAYLAGYRAGVREAAARVEALGREAPGPEVVMNLGALLDGPSVPPTAALVQATAEARRIPWRGAEWLPVDTAPNDSKSVILFIPGRGPLVSWRCVPGGAWYAPGPYRGPEEPTHWMPIPTLPIGANP